MTVCLTVDLPNGEAAGLGRETSLAGLGKGKHACLGVWLGQVRLG